MIRLFITGGSGTLGTALLSLLKNPKYEEVFHFLAPTSTEFDITDPIRCAELAEGSLGTFDWVFNLAAYTKVDLAETDRESCFGLNAIAPGWLAKASADLGARFLQISTDCVFNGEKGSPYIEEDLPSPIQAYGESKLEGELAVTEAHPAPVIFRTSWLYGTTGKSFPQIILEKLAQNKPIQVVKDQIGTPTNASDLAENILLSVMCNIPAGTYHSAGREVLSRFEWAKRIAEDYSRKCGQTSPPILPISSAEFPTPARRPKNSALNSRKFKRAIEGNGA